MTLFRIVIILGLVLGILGGSAYYSYELFWKPQMPPEAAEKKPPPPPPNPAVVAFEKARATGRHGDREAERHALRDFLTAYPDSQKSPEARTLLGNLNAAGLFSPTNMEGKIPYTVVKGDSLVRIASKFKTNAELIYRVNNLETINLQIGQQLLIPQMNVRLVVDAKTRTVTVYNNGQFFKRYPILSMRERASGTTKVVDKLALNGPNRVAFGSKNYIGSDRWIILGRGGLVLRAMPEDVSGRPPVGILMSPSDLEEVFLLVSRGVPVTIQ